MTQENLFNKNNLKTIAIFTIVFIVLSLALSLTQTPKYQASVRMIVVFNQEGVDPYTATRTGDYITNVLSEVIYSDSFVETVFKSGFSLKDELGDSQRVRMKNWKKMVKVAVKENKGIIGVNVLNRDRNQADQFARAIALTLINKHQAYHGLGDKVAIKIIDNPTVPDRWAEPNVWRNTLIGLVAGIIIGFTVIVVFPEQKIFMIFPRRAKKIIQVNPDEEIKFATPADMEMSFPEMTNPTQEPQWGKFPETPEATGPNDTNGKEYKW